MLSSTRTTNGNLHFDLESFRTFQSKNFLGEIFLLQKLKADKVPYSTV